MSKILITGTVGFIFSNFIRRAIYEKQPHQFVSIDRVAGNANALYFHKNHSFHIADIRDQHIIDKIFQFEQPDIVIHGAAESHVDYSLTDPNSFVTSNVLGTQTIINSCVKHKIRKLIYISTDEVYGQLNNEDEASWPEDAPLNPRSPYAATKAAGELLVKAAYQAYGLKYNITRCSNNYGPRQTTEKLLPKTIKSILNDQPIIVYGQGLQIRDWTHVFDNCTAINTIINSGEDNQVYNISANQECTNIELIQKVCNIIGKGHNLVKFIDDPRGNAHDFRYSVDCSKLKKLGWKPEIKLSDGLLHTVEWYNNNKWMIK
jgi:dTDP-glucose 4,6-dehydratase